MVANARALGETLQGAGMDLVTGGTDSHLILVDLQRKGVTGKALDESLGRANITANKNGVPFDPKPFTITSGVRLGSPACTTRGMGVEEFRQIGRLIGRVADGLAVNAEDNGAVEDEVRKEVLDLTRRFPIYG
jgi:glycine hydroxymethyltransferase